MSNLRGKTVVVAADCEVAAALARRLAKEGARIVLGSPRSDELDETLAELRWECATILWRPMDPHDPAAVGELADYAESAFGPLEAIVSGGALCQGAGSAPRAPSPKARRARRLIRLAARGERAAAGLFADENLRVTTIMAQADGVAVSPESVADAVAFALAGPGGVEIGSLFLRPMAQAA
jgi:NADP-dependent 3-hydroxy acid dehydrogenase YdfG